jgi:hypothetical protein
VTEAVHVSALKQKHKSVGGQLKASILQVRADTSQPCGYKVELEPLNGAPTWCWAYEMDGDGSIQLQLKEFALALDSTTSALTLAS